MKKKFLKWKNRGYYSLGITGITTSLHPTLQDAITCKQGDKDEVGAICSSENERWWAEDNLPTPQSNAATNRDKNILPLFPPDWFR